LFVSSQFKRWAYLVVSQNKVWTPPPLITRRVSYSSQQSEQSLFLRLFNKMLELFWRRGIFLFLVFAFRSLFFVHTPVFKRAHVAQSLVFCVMFCISLFVLLSFFYVAIVLFVLLFFSFVIVLSVLRFMASGYPFGIFKLFLFWLLFYVHLIVLVHDFT